MSYEKIRVQKSFTLPKSKILELISAAGYKLPALPYNKINLDFNVNELTISWLETEDVK